MKALVQRVARASVRCSDGTVSTIGPGLCCLVGIHRDDDPSDREWIINKILNLRIFDDPQGVMNLSVLDIRGEILAVSQFTLYGNTRKGNRPSYQEAMPPADAELFFNLFLHEFNHRFPGVQTGKFGDHMNVELVNSGPVTLMLESPSKK